jgi:uncharacterized protein (DUF2384 family)
MRNACDSWVHRYLGAGILDGFVYNELSSMFRHADRTLAKTSVIAHAEAVFGDRRRASHWLDTPLRVLSGRSPAQALGDGDVSAVGRILTRIEHNIPS